MAAFNSLVFEPTTSFSGYGGMSLTVDSSGNLGNVSTPSTANLSVDNGVMSMKTPTNWGMVGGVISAIGGMVTGYYASRVQKSSPRKRGCFRGCGRVPARSHVFPAQAGGFPLVGRPK